MEIVVTSQWKQEQKGHLKEIVINIQITACPDLQKFWVRHSIWRADICVADILNSLVASSTLIVVSFHKPLKDRRVSQVANLYQDQEYFNRKHILGGIGKFDQSITAPLFQLLFC